MSDILIRAAGATTVYVPPSGAEALAEALGTTIAGLPLPLALRGPSVAPRTPASVREGINVMLGAPLG